MQPVDFTTLAAVRAELHQHWLPARCEQFYQRDRYTLFIALRTLNKRGWLAISWHPQAARIHIAKPPPKQPDTFTFSQQLKHQLGGLALTQINILSPWERVLNLQFAARPDEPAVWHIYVEVMGKYSNVILTHANGQIVTAAHQVSEQQSSVRPIQTGKPYVHPPKIRGPLPSLADSFETWRDRVTLIPGKLQKMLVQSHSGVSSSIARQLISATHLPANSLTTDLSPTHWQTLFTQWQNWLQCLETNTFIPGWEKASSAKALAGYTVLGLGMTQPANNVQTLLDEYYRYQFNREEFRRLHHRISQRLKKLLGKLRQKADTFQVRLQQAQEANHYRQQADLLMANLHQWQAGMTQIELTNFESGDPVILLLNPEKNATQNAQAFYKKHQKLKRARLAVLPLIQGVKAEIDYLEQVEESVNQVRVYEREADLRSIEETLRELITQGYLHDSTGYQGGSQSANPKTGQLNNRQRRQQNNRKTPTKTYQRTARKSGQVFDQSSDNFRQYTTPQGIDILIGRNNAQNERLTFKQATDYDLWLHAQEIPGSHVLIRLNAGDVPTDATLQLAASLAAYYSRARQSDQVPVIYTEPKNVYKPKGALPGMVIYKHERVLWGKPQQAQDWIEGLEAD